MKERILGLDLSGGTATAFLLDTETYNQYPSLGEFLGSPDFNPFEVELTYESLEKLVALKPDLAIFEPTGQHYERVFVHWFNKFEIPFKRCVGRRLANFRVDKGLPKNDEIDAFSLTLYAYYKLDPSGRDYDPKAFISECALPELRRWWLQRHGASRRRARMVNRIRQQLAGCFPEAMNAVLKREWGELPPTLIRWLAGELEPGLSRSQWENRAYGGRVYRKGKFTTIPGTCGEGIDEDLRTLAREFYALDMEMLNLENQIDELLSQERFKPYIDAFRKIGGSNNMIACWMTRIYPIESYFIDGKPLIEKKPSRKSGKICTYDRSLAQLKAALGAGTMEDSSGIRQKKSKRKKSRHYRRDQNSSTEKAEITIGDRFSRRAFYLWASGRIETTLGKHRKGNQIKFDFDQRLLIHTQEQKDKGKNEYQRTGNLQGYFIKLLYKEILKNLQTTC